MKQQKFILTFLTILYLEIIYHLFTFKSFLIKDIIYISIFTLLVSIFIDLITSFFKHKNNKIFYISIVIFLTLLFIAQFVNYLFYGNVISIYSIFHGGQVFEFFSQIYTVMINNIIPIILLTIPSILTIIFKNKIITLDTHYKLLSRKTFIMIGLYITGVLSLFLSGNNIYSVKNIYFNKHVPNQSVKSLGLMTTMRLDLFRIISKFEENVLVTAPKEEIPKEIKYNKLEIDFNNLIENTDNNSIKSIHQYISNTSPTNQNDYTGYFKDKNLIYITAEAFSPIAVDKEVTPTLYKLVNNGFKFNNFYSPVYYVSTSDGEYVNLTSLLPKESVWSMARSSKNSMPYTYGNLFNKLGYTTNAYHNGAYKFYDRHLSLPNMGFNFTGCGNGLEKIMNCKPWPQSDLEMIDSTFNLYSDNNRFMTYYMSISGHLEYNFGGNNMAYKNKEAVDHLPYSTPIKAYIASQIELDKALNSLINKLEEKGILDDTVIVMSTDHYPYGLKLNEIKELMDIEDEKLDVHKNHLIIWNNQIEEPIEINKYSSSLDILPTVLNLFGIEYDSRLLMGTDILSDNEGVIIFNDRSWITSYGKYNATKNTFKEFVTPPDNYIEEINNSVYNKYVISKNILENDYYKHVLGE